MYKEIMDNAPGGMIVEIFIECEIAFQPAG